MIQTAPSHLQAIVRQGHSICIEHYRLNEEEKQEEEGAF